MKSNNKNVIITQNKVINVDGGDVYHVMKIGDAGFSGFGEAYFSFINNKFIKGWKRHKNMTLNLSVIHGSIKIVTYDDRNSHKLEGVFDEYILSQENYLRITVPPMIWVAFMGKSKKDNILLNLASIKHDPHEVDKKDLEEIKYSW